MSQNLNIYPQDFIHKIGFDKIIALLKSYCISTLGVEYVEELKPSANLSKITYELQLSDELSQVLANTGSSISEQGFYDLRKEINALSAEGNWWEPDQFMDLRSLLRNSYDLIRLFKKEETEYLKQLYDKIEFPDDLLKRLEKVFNDKGEINDNATPELHRLRRTLEQNRQQVRKSIDLIFRNAKNDGLVPEGSSISIRDGRMVIPIVAEAKRRVRGFIHDESATGQTVFIEPAAVLEGNNRQRELEYEERREVIKILKDVSRHSYINSEQLLALTEFMGQVDFLRAKTRLSERLKAIKPVITSESKIALHNARHPLLLLSHPHVVPLDIQLNEQQRIVLISGPNAGGKSVSLKTVALLQFMVQCGLNVPVGEGSSFGIFNQLFIDIGDEQSIENDLSTYSSHLKNMRHMLENVDGKTLILIDEFGSGTEPHFGGALAEGMLEVFVEKGTKGVITTHYANLKTFADDNEGVVNAAMLFDMKELKPLYKLSIGKPGSSHALDIARNTGLPANIIEKAKALLGQETVDYEQALANLQDQLKKVQDKQQQLDSREKKLQQLVTEYTKLKEGIEKNQKKLLNSAKAEAEAIVQKANREIEKTIRHIKENKAEKKETRKIRQRLDDFKQQQKERQSAAAVKEPDDTVIKEGDYVELTDSGVIGQVQNLQGDSAEVLLGDLKTIVKLKRLRKSSRKDARQQSSGRRRGTDFTSKLASFSANLDIRGKRAEEAITIVDKFLDDALLAGASELRILHGKGNGILKELVRKHLKGYKQVQKLADEHIERGGAGITVVELEQ